MKPRLDRMRWPMLALSAVLVGGWVAKEVGWRVNITGSLPGSLYRVTEAAHARVGDYIQFCPLFAVVALPDAKPGEPSCLGKVPLIKRVVAVSGDRVSVSENGVWINGVLLPDSRPRRTDRIGNPLSVAWGEHVVPPVHVWVAGEHPDSFDSRYFGSVPAAMR